MTKLAKYKPLHSVRREMTPDFDLKQYLERYRLIVEKALETALPENEGPEARVVEAMHPNS